MNYEIEVDNQTVQIELKKTDAGFQATIDGRSYEATLIQPEPNLYTLFVNGRVYEFRTSYQPGRQEVAVNSAGLSLTTRLIDRKKRQGEGKAAGGSKTITAPMPGRVVQIMKSVGDEVADGESVIIVEAMKMQNELASPKASKIKEIKVQVGQTVIAGEVLVVIE
ncbi:MAG: hypothetical protein JNN15_08405 [Blastocatellia bacterium]|nr:hypothetical protein [Blastocatellia bacterium]